MRLSLFTFTQRVRQKGKSDFTKKHFLALKGQAGCSFAHTLNLGPKSLNSPVPSTSALFCRTPFLYSADWACWLLFCGCSFAIVLLRLLFCGCSFAIALLRLLFCGCSFAGCSFAHTLN